MAERLFRFHYTTHDVHIYRLIMIPITMILPASHNSLSVTAKQCSVNEVHLEVGINVPKTILPCLLYQPSAWQGVSAPFLWWPTMNLRVPCDIPMCGHGEVQVISLAVFGTYLCSNTPCAYPDSPPSKRPMPPRPPVQRLSGVASCSR